MKNLDYKSKAIEKAWVDAVQQLVNHDESGWAKCNHLQKEHIIAYRNVLDFDKVLGANGELSEMICRPKSLSGIESNNGWVRIEADGSNLPNDETAEYHACFQSKPFGKDMTADEIKEGFNCGVVTHYRPIEKHQPPIY